MHVAVTVLAGVLKSHRAGGGGLSGVGGEAWGLCTKCCGRKLKPQCYGAERENTVVYAAEAFAAPVEQNVSQIGRPIQTYQCIDRQEAPGFCEKAVLHIPQLRVSKHDLDPADQIDRSGT